MTTREAHGQPQLTGERTAASENGVIAASVVGSILGGLVGGIALYSLTNFHLPFMASIVGLGGSAAFGVWMGAALVMGLLFASIVEPAIDYYASASTWLTERSALFRTIADVVPAGPAAGVGLLFGIVMGDLIGVIGVPAAAGGNVPPVEAGSIVVGYAVFGLVLGVGYEHARAGTIPVPSVSVLSPTARGAALAPLLAGAISGVIVYAGQPVYLVFLSTVPGYGTLNAGFGIWMGLTILLGLLFAAVSHRHAARGNSTTGYGFVYGVVVAVFVGLVGIPALVSATTEWSLDFGDVAGTTLAAFVVYGLVLGSVFGKSVNEQPLRPTFLVGRTRATVIASLVAGVLSGALFYATAPVAMMLLGYLPGPGGVAAGFATWVGIAVLLGVGFATLPARRIERQEYPGQTGLKLGLGYGIISAIVVGMLVIPRAVDAVIVGFSVAPLSQGSVLGAYVLMGLVHGITYGAIKGQRSVAPRFLQGRETAVFGGAALAGATSAVVAYAASIVPGVYLSILGGAIGVPSVAGGLVVWAVISVTFAVLFVPLAGSVVESRVGLLRGLGVGAVYGAVLTAAVGVYGVPSATALEVPHTNAPVIAYLVFGLFFGGAYGVIRERSLARGATPTSTAIASRGQRAVLFGSLFGGSVSGLIIYHMVGPVSMLYFSSLIGYGNFAIGWAVWLLISLLLGGLFATTIGPRLRGYANSMDEWTERDEDIDAVFGDFFDRAPITSTAAVAGFVYGVVLAVAVGAIAFPLAVNTMTGPGISLGMPLLNGYFMAAFVAYGVFMGIGYGVVREF